MVKVLPRNTSAETIRSEREKKTAKVLKTLKHSAEESEAAALARSASLPYVDLNIFPIDVADVLKIPEADARKLGIVLFQKKGRNIRVATLDPHNAAALEYIQTIEDREGWTAKYYVASHPSIERAWEYYAKPFFLDYLNHLKISLTDQDLEKFEKEFGDLLSLRDRILEVPMTEVLETVMTGAIKLRSSDIHFEPEEGSVIRLRYRIDGVLQDIGRLPGSIYPLLVSRVKMLGKMKLNVRDRSQDGHTSITLGDRKIDIRVSAIPGHYGESIVMRLLDQDAAHIPLDDLGLHGRAYEKVEKAFQKPNGLLLNTGPTGSGKTTTLYAILQKINNPETKIITIEDPIEYEIQNIIQTQVSNDRRYSFAEGLRSIVRQDPDVILVGEIRDDETADIAVNAGLTGHLVLSTLHTNSAAGSVARLIEMGVRPNLIPTVTNAFIAQRLVRQLCTHCKESYAPAEETVNSIKEILSLISPKADIDIPKNIPVLFRPKGCTECNFTGYKGRIGIFEVLSMSEKIAKNIEALASESEIMQTALEDGMITMSQDGVLKAIEGVTSLDEVWRVTGEGEFLREIYDRLMEQTLSRSFFIGNTVIEEISPTLDSLQTFGSFLEKDIQRDVLKALFAGAILLSAGDIHLEPEEKTVAVRLRIDGILQTIAAIPYNEYPTLLGDIKLLSGLKTEEKAGIRDSRFSVQLESPVGNSQETKIDIRVSIIQGGFGETIVMRLLNRGATALDIHGIGLRTETITPLLRAAKKPTGIILNTGPTGSGKTTTLYSLINEIKTPEVKIITVEDPIEYQLSGILQTQVDEANGYTFSTALRSLLRQNPNIVMIGEIRDDETAKIAYQAALTGHLVIATLHTNNASGSIARLLSMGVGPDDIVNAGGIYIAQRLVRTLCSCKKEIPFEGDAKATVEKALASISPKANIEIPKADRHFQPVGCKLCNGTGYKGRVALSEALALDKEIQLLIARGALGIEIEEQAVKNGMITLFQDGILRVLTGETSLDEVLRVAES